MKQGKLHTHTHTSKLYQMTYKTSKPQINKLHATNWLGFEWMDGWMNEWMDGWMDQSIN